MKNFEFKELSIKGVTLIKHFSHIDERGFFSKYFVKEFCDYNGIEFNIDEIFASSSQKNVIRGLHFQTKNPQAKIVTVIQGSVKDVIVDLRKDSSTYLKYLIVELNGNNASAVYIPSGCAHGFLSECDNTIMLYMCNGKYDKLSDTGIAFNDVTIGIEWPVSLTNVIVSERDKMLPTYLDAKLKGILEFIYEE